jgi:hypothetical protein
MEGRNDILTLTYGMLRDEEDCEDDYKNRTNDKQLGHLFLMDEDRISFPGDLHSKNPRTIIIMSLKNN